MQKSDKYEEGLSRPNAQFWKNFATVFTNNTKVWSINQRNSKCKKRPTFEILLFVKNCTLIHFEYLCNLTYFFLQTFMSCLLAALRSPRSLVVGLLVRRLICLLYNFVNNLTLQEFNSSIYPTYQPTYVPITVRLEKAIGSKGKQPCKHTASETQTHSQSFQKKKVAGMG